MASMLQGKSGVREMARALGRSPSTISREIKRNGAVKGYASASAHVRCRVRRQEARPALKLDVDGVLFGVVHEMLHWRWSPEQVAMTLARIFPRAMSIACQQRPSTAVFTPSPWGSCAAT